MVNKRKIYICTTYYHVLVTLAKTLLEKSKIKNTDIIVCDDIIEAESLCQKLKKYNLFNKIFFVKQSEMPEFVSNNIFKNLLYLHPFNYAMNSKYINVNFDNYSDIYIFHDDTKIGHYLNDAGYYYHLIEDSLNFYQKILNTPFKYAVISNWKYYLKRILNYKYLPLGNSKYVLDIEVNENKNLQIKRKKVVEINRKDLLNKAFFGYKDIILGIFFNLDIKDLLKEENKALVLTEPLYKDKILQSKQEQLLFYRKIVQDLKRQKFKVYIKPHPRDSIDYSSLISDINVINRAFPIEIFNFIDGLSFSIVASKNSSCLDALDFAKAKMNYYKKID